MTEFKTQDFIRDFLEEATEHLQAIHHNLLALEEISRVPGSALKVENVLASTELIKELFRSYHTLKGLAGMVGLPAAEALSHAMESILRAIQTAEIEITNQVIDRLIESTHTLEAVIGAVANPQAGPQDIQPDLSALEALLSGKKAPDPTRRVSRARKKGKSGRPPQPVSAGDPPDIPLPEVAGSLSPLEQQQLQAARAAGRSLALVIFTPDPQKASQGHNVSEARQALRQAGELIKATPLVQGSSIRFAFIVASAQPLRPEDFPAMEWISLSSPAETARGDGGAVGIAPPSPETPAAPAPNLQPEAPAGSFLGAASGASVRVDLERLNELMRLVSDLVVTRYHLRELLPALQGAPPAVLESLEITISRMERSLRELRSEVVRTRMVPLAEVFGLMPMAVRDLARASGKEVHLVMEGEATKVDKLLVERLLDPLLHLVRNAITHGIEPAAERVAAGKQAQGCLLLNGSPEGDHIRISVSDDGRGIDAEAVAAQAEYLGLLGRERAGPGGQRAHLEKTAPEEQAAEASRQLSEYELLELICRPGFSTRGEADLGAGRGVGMDVVRRGVEAIGGSLGLHTSPGQGSEFILRLPLTLTIVDALIASCGSERYAIPRSAVDRVIEIDPAQISQVENGELYHDREATLTLLRLENLFKLPDRHSAPFLSGLVSMEGDRRTVLVVDRLIGLREVVLRPMADPLIARPGIAGATELGDGRAILILDLKTLLYNRQ